MGKRKVPELYRAPFPLYSVKVDPGSGLVVVAGGGGASKTGIKNAVHFLELQRVGEHEFSATLLHAHDTETKANMNLALADDVIAAGQDGNCCLMKFKQAQSKTKLATSKDAGNSQQQNAPRRRAGKGDKPSQDSADSELKDETAQIQVQGLAEVQSDENPRTLCRRWSGSVRIEFPSLKKKYDFKAHDDEVEDLDMSPGNKLVTVGRDFSCSVWSGDQLAMSLKWHQTRPGTAEKTYRYMACRFGLVEDQKRRCGSTRCRSLTNVNGSLLPASSLNGTERASCPCSLPPVGQRSSPHWPSVTLGRFWVWGQSLDLSPSTSLSHCRSYSPRGRQLRGNHEAAMFSVAVDSRCQLHSLNNRSSCPVWLVLFSCGLMVVIVILLIQNLFPGLL
ncbi:hypothetical protein WMY93_031292 [Mugilogobius chulae]|uniref:Prolactin regulatory element-binding protein n=1 Tax=Mugilogobius chulae TaxID=88201 RepID=A0AAW0MIB3_9GOBI